MDTHNSGWVERFNIVQVTKKITLNTLDRSEFTENEEIKANFIISVWNKMYINVKNV